MLLFTIDFEASCLPSHGRSFPIEVGVADLNGWSKAWIIRPHPDWSDWTWTAEAERLHGLSREQIEQEGLPPRQVAYELAAVVGEAVVLADSCLDDHWLATLCKAACTRRRFDIGHVQELIERLGSSPEDISNAVRTADGIAPIRHRARLDALWLATVARKLQEMAAQRSVPELLLFS